MPEDTNNSHTHTKETTFRLKKHLLWASTRPDASGAPPGQWKSTDLCETQSMGKPFSDQTGYFFLKQHLQGFWLYKSYIYTRKDSTVVLIRVLLFIQSRQMTTNTEPSHAQCFCLLKAQVFPTTVAKLLSLKGACCVHVNKYLMHILYLDKKNKRAM